MQIALVLRSGGIYEPKHVAALAAQLREHAPRTGILCLTDTPLQMQGVNTIALSYGWPGWWSKMELFKPNIAGDLLYLDLDTVVRGSLAPLLAIKQRAMLRDFYRPNGLQSAVMVLPEADRAVIWDSFYSNPQRAMQASGIRGDQHFLERHWLGDHTLRIQDVLPEQVVSYKVHCRDGVPPNARVVCAHGKPKLWDVPEFKHLYE